MAGRSNLGEDEQTFLQIRALGLRSSALIRRSFQQQFISFLLGTKRRLKRLNKSA